VVGPRQLSDPSQQILGAPLNNDFNGCEGVARTHTGTVVQLICTPKIAAWPMNARNVIDPFLTAREIERPLFQVWKTSLCSFDGVHVAAATLEIGQRTA
jgi:hypothetical protein